MIRFDYKQLADAVNDEMMAKGLTSLGLSRIIHGELGLKVSTAASYVNHLRIGAPFGSASDVAYQNPNVYDRLAKILYAIGLSNDNTAIAILRENHPTFQYPPQNAISYEGIRSQLQQQAQAKKLKKDATLRKKRVTRTFIAELSKLDADTINELIELAKRLQQH